MLRSLGGGVVSDGISELKSFPLARGPVTRKNSYHIRAAIFVAARDKSRHDLDKRLGVGGVLEIRGAS